MDPYHGPGDEPPEGADDTALPDRRIDYTILDERERALRDAAGTSRDLAASLLGGT